MQYQTSPAKTGVFGKREYERVRKSRLCENTKLTVLTLHAKKPQSKPKTQAQTEVQPEMDTKEKTNIVSSIRKHIKNRLMGSSKRKSNFWQIMLLNTWCQQDFGNY